MTTQQTNRNNIQAEEEKKLIEMVESIKADKKKMRLLKKCQSHIKGIHLRKKLRVDNLRRSETINFDLIGQQELPLPKEEIHKFFEDYPPLVKGNIKVEKKEPLMQENRIFYYGEWDLSFFTKHGRGIQIWPDGSYYKGYWENNKAEGKGEFVHSSGDVYIGYWHRNKREGKGIYHSKKGMEYNGYWKNDKQDGRGKEVWEDGSVYNGYYSNGKKSGKGEMIWANGCSYKGNFENGNINGRGRYIFNDKRVYEGNFVNNVFEGKGTFTWPNGDKYHGNFKNDKRQGFGIFTFSNGKIFKGMWKDGKRDGEFLVYKPEKGIWIKKKYEFEKKKNNNILKEINENEEDKLYSDKELENVDEIKPTEEYKIDEDVEVDF